MYLLYFLFVSSFFFHRMYIVYSISVVGMHDFYVVRKLVTATNNWDFLLCFIIIKNKHLPINSDICNVSQRIADAISLSTLPIDGFYQCSHFISMKRRTTVKFSLSILSMWNDGHPSHSYQLLELHRCLFLSV